MADKYEIYGNFRIITECSDLQVLARALNETARQFADILQYNEEKRGYMIIQNDLEIEIPVNQPLLESPEKQAEVEQDEGD